MYHRHALGGAHSSSGTHQHKDHKPRKKVKNNNNVKVPAANGAGVVHDSNYKSKKDTSSTSDKGQQLYANQTKPQQQKPQQQIYDDSSTSSDSSILSNHEDYSSSDEDDDSFIGNKEENDVDDKSSISEDDKDVTTIQQQWVKLERNFHTRDRMFKRLVSKKGITNIKNRSFFRSLQRREYLVRYQQRNELLRRQQVQQQQQQQQTRKKVGKKTKTKTNDNKSNFIIPELSVPDPDTLEEIIKEQKKRSFIRRLYDVIIYELNSTIPGMICVFLYCIAYASLYEFIYSVCDEIKRKISEEYMNEADIKTIYHIILFFLGSMMMRMTGDIFFFLNQHDYSSMKFDYHNKRILNSWDFKLMKHVRSNNILRPVLYISGFFLCYIASQQFYNYLSEFFDETSILLTNLPSSLKNAESNDQDGICVAEKHLIESLGSGTCQKEIEIHVQQYVKSIQEDMAYTWSVMPASTHDAYWLTWVQNFDSATGKGKFPLYSFFGTLRFCSLVCALCLTLMGAYGFYFWHSF